MSNICDCCGLVPDDMRFVDTRLGRLRICRVCFRTPISVLETVRKLKSALATTACHVGGGAVANCSVDFLCYVPEEVKAVVDTMKQQVADLTRRLAEAEAERERLRFRLMDLTHQVPLPIVTHPPSDRTGWR